MKKLVIAAAILLTLFSPDCKIYSQTANTSSEIKDWIDNQFAEGMESYNIPGATFILMQGDSIIHMNSYGIADIETQTPVDSELSIFRVASISKTFVATAVMQLYEEGKLQLDQDINEYLQSFKIKYDFGEPITIKHLLTHTAGFDERNIATSVRTEEEVIPLAQYLKENMPPQIRPAGEAFTYSNHGYALLALIVEDVSGMPFHEYATKRILEPLDMDSSGFMRQPQLRNRYVKSYLQAESSLIPYKLDFSLNYPAGSLSATTADMSNYISLFLNKGNYQGTQILDSTTVQYMFTTGYKHYDASPYGWLSGFGEESWNGIKLVRHAGDVQGFASNLILIPEKNLGLFLCVNASKIPNSRSRIFIREFENDLLHKLMPEKSRTGEKPEILPETVSLTAPLDKFTGTYRYSRYAQNTLDKLAVLIGFAPEIEIRAKGDTLEIPEHNDKLIPVSDSTFYSTKDETVKGFGKNNKGEIAYFFPTGTSSFHKLSWYEPVSFQIYWIGGIVLILLSALIVAVLRKIFAKHKKSYLIKKLNYSNAVLIILFLAVIGYLLMNTDPQEFFYGVPLEIKVALVIPFLIIPMALFSIWILIKAWWSKKLGKIDLLFQSLIVIAVLTFIPWLMYWNLIGFNY